MKTRQQSFLWDSDDIHSDDEGSQDANEHSDQSFQDHDSSGDGQAKSAESPGSDVHMACSDSPCLVMSYVIDRPADF